jgi:hypothetical protein
MSQHPGFPLEIAMLPARARVCPARLARLDRNAAVLKD